MGKRKRISKQVPGVHWAPMEEGWVPHFVWKKMSVQGPPRPAKALLPEEAFKVVMEYANMAGKGIFGVAPYTYKLVEGREVFQANEAFDAIPNIKSLLGGLKTPEDIEIKGLEGQPELVGENPDGVPLDQIDPAIPKV